MQISSSLHLSVACFSLTRLSLPYVSLQVLNLNQKFKFSSRTSSMFIWNRFSISEVCYLHPNPLEEGSTSGVHLKFLIRFYRLSFVSNLNLCIRAACDETEASKAADAINVFNDHTCTKFILQITKLLLHFPGLKFNFPIPDSL
ncbi:hypothetical protein OIU74_020201 [Salix koriyanagi]|uniref:Uncharacterized protein n=1 Tax=Salix koriyanagi TaxID=2511006 RepID=A0A9Q0P5C8_9ROSI|nr:hypothetical protein OIU74_020201 [Salix koriyanagi]